MSFFTNFRADRLITEIKTSTEPLGAATLKAVAKLKDLGPGAIEPTVQALADADKNATVALVDVLATLVSNKTFPHFIKAMIEGGPRTIAGISWALTSCRNYTPGLLLEALTMRASRNPRAGVINAHRAPHSSELLTAGFPGCNEGGAVRIVADMERQRGAGDAEPAAGQGTDRTDAHHQSCA